MMVNKTIRFDEDQLEKIIESAKENGLNFSDYMRKIIDFYQKSPTEINDNFKDFLKLIDKQSDQISKLADIVIEQNKLISGHDILLKRMYNQGFYTYKVTAFNQRGQTGNPDWDKLLADIKAQAIEVKF